MLSSAYRHQVAQLDNCVEGLVNSLIAFPVFDQRPGTRVCNDVDNLSMTVGLPSSDRAPGAIITRRSVDTYFNIYLLRVSE